MENLGKKGNRTKKLRALEALALARASSAGALLSGAFVYTNPLATAVQQVPFVDTPNQFLGGGSKARTYLVVASVHTIGTSAFDLTGVVQLTMNGTPLVVIPQSPIGLAPGGSAIAATRRATLMWLVTLAANPLVTTINRFGIQSDIGGGNTHQIPPGGAEILVLELT